MEDSEKLKKENVNPMEKANIFSKLFFCWTLPTFIQGAKRDLNEEDLFKPLSSHESSILGDQLEEAWEIEEKLNQHPTVFRPLAKVFRLEIIITAMSIFTLEFALKLSQPILIERILHYYSPDQTDMTKNDAYLYSSSLVVIIFINVLWSHLHYLYIQGFGMKMRIALSSLIYRKSLKLSNAALAETTAGQMVNLLSNDVSRMDMTVSNIHYIWLAPFETCLIFYLLYNQAGLAGTAGIIFLALFTPVQMYMGKKASDYRLRTALRTDNRVRLMNEIISGIQVIKMYTWEKSFAKLVELARKAEIRQIKAASYLRGVFIAFILFLNRTAVYMSIVTYVLTGGRIRADYVYVVISFYTMLRQAMTMYFPKAISTIAESRISLRRITKFLLHDEISNEKHLKMSHCKNNKIKLSPSSQSPHYVTNTIGVTINNASARWVSSKSDYTLRNINMTVCSEELIAIVGPVGSGKSSLLHAILGELPVSQGHIKVEGAISYASQEPWVFAGSVRQNILFGLEMDNKKYEEVIKVCALERDFALFPYGDRTLVGERGVTLSGGQKARINLARAVYKDADIYLLDDPLSAVDAQVGKQLFDECITGYLKNKCTILVTHQLQYLRNVDRIYLLESGEIVAHGTYLQIQNSGKSYTKLLESDSNADEDTKSVKSKVEDDKRKDADKNSPTEVKEHRNVGSVSRTVYRRYFGAGGDVCAIINLFSLVVLNQIIGTCCDYFITFWVNLEQYRMEEELKLSLANSTLENNMNEISTNISQPNVSLPINNTRSESPQYSSFLKTFEDFFTTENCIYVYTSIVASVIILTLLRTSIFYRFCMRSAKHLHNNMFNRIVYAPMRFFNMNSSGRILNRFSKDMGSIDEALPSVLLDTMQLGFSVTSIAVLIGIINPWIFLPTFVMLVVFYGLRIFYLRTSRSIKRMEGTTKSPVFSHINSSLQGLTTIRAFGAQEVLRKEFDNHQNLHSSAFFMFLGCTRTFGVWLDMICSAYIGFVILGFLVIGKENYAGNVGLSITQAMSLTGMFQWGMRQWSELENQMTSVERVLEYTDIKPEKQYLTKPPPKNWPEFGNILFKSVYMRYAENEPYILNNLSFSIKSKEKVGIVGRTGAGKSSLISALFLLTNIEGDILIDNVNTKEIPLSELRSKISIIPQEPVLFSGTMRKNLDPFDEYEDADLWYALEQVELKKVIYELSAGLETLVSEGGSNFSVGERQLICLARAIIRSNRILVLDEATANVDPRTDALIQTTIREQFNECTVLTIAHRLHTVMDSDKVLVMDAGKAVEFDHPYRLLQNSNGIFHELVKQTGNNMSASLFKTAQESYNNMESIPS